MDRKALVEKLELVGRALATTNLVPIFQCYAFDKEKVSAFDDSLGIVAPCETEEAFAINGNVLLGLLTNSHAEAVDFSIEDKNDVVVKTGKSTFKLPFFNKDEFLFTEPELQDQKTLQLDEDLIDGLSACLLTTGKDQAQPAFMGICLKQQKGKLALYATDGDAISRFVLSYSDLEGGATYMMPNAFCDTLIKICKDTNFKTGVLELTPEWAKATLDTGYTIYGRLIVLDNPLDHEAEINNTIKGDINYVEIPKGLPGALSRARVVADQESAKTMLTVEAKKLKLVTETSMGIVRDALPFPTYEAVQANVSAAIIQGCVGLCSHMAIMENCCSFQEGDRLFILTSNMGE